MDGSSAQLDIRIPSRVLVEVHAGDPDVRDVIVEMEDGSLFTAMFVTLEHLKHQMELSFALTDQIPGTVPARFAVLEIPHIIVENLDRDTIEDTIDNLLAMETFKSIFTQVTEDATETTTTTTTGERATQELAAVVLSEVIVVE